MTSGSASTSRSGTLVLVLGDHLCHDSAAFAGFDPARDRVLMIEAPGEATHVWSAKPRIVVFLSAMRHFRDELAARGVNVHYVALDDADAGGDGFELRLAHALAALAPGTLRLLEPGEWRLARIIEAAAAHVGCALQVVDDTHVLCSRADFARFAGKKPRLLMESFYREMRRRNRILLAEDGEPEGGRWNYDADNRGAWPKRPASRAGPGLIAEPERFAPDATTREVIALVERRFADHPGTLADFAWPVTREEALRALAVFVESRLASFGDFQDAMWTATPFGWHALLSSSLNLHLLDPREVVMAAELAYRSGAIPLASAEGFLRQVVGWREFIRGVYWRDMPAMREANHLRATRPLPGWYWTGDTRMVCAREAVAQTLRHGYAHHIQRLMVTGLFAMLAEVEPKRVADWYLAVYVDAVEWAELPNVAGMALYADGGRFTTKPYAASGAYIDRMSNYCGGCAYAPTEAAAASRGKPICPFTALYWNFLDRHEAMLAANPRTMMMAKSIAAKPAAERDAIRAVAADLLERVDAL